jgi:hypothetical protein
MNETKELHITAFVSIIALIVSVAGVIYQQTQNTISFQQKELSVHSMLIQRNARILELLLEHPETRPYFYNNKPLPKEGTVLGQSATLAEMWTDFFEQVLIQQNHLPENMRTTWMQYASDMYGSSTAIQQYFSESCGWYVVELRELWGGCNESG